MEGEKSQDAARRIAKAARNSLRVVHAKEVVAADMKEILSTPLALRPEPSDVEVAAGDESEPI